MASVDFIDDSDIRLLENCNCRWKFSENDLKRGTPDPNCRSCNGKGQYLTEFGDNMVIFLKFIGVIKEE